MNDVCWVLDLFLKKSLNKFKIILKDSLINKEN
jgi:hypothetical protein